MLTAIFALAGWATAPAPAQADLDYTLTVQSAPERSFAGALRFRAAEEGPTHVTLDEGWGGTSNVTAQLEFLEVTTLDGASLELTEVEPARWLVDCDASEELVARWAFPANALQDEADLSLHYMPIVNDSLVHVIGSLGLVGVPHLDELDELAIRFRWEGTEELGWKAVTSFGAGAGPHEVAASQHEFRHALFLAGAFDLELRDVGGQDLAVAVAPGGWGFTSAEFADLTSAVVETQREFMDDWEKPWYLVSLIPVGAASSRGFSLGGTGLSNAFATFCQPGASLDPEGPHRTRVVMLLAHEMFHEWNGKIIRRVAEEEIPLYWFSEGFTEFFERRTALLAGLISPAEAVADVNDHLQSYATSPARDLGNARIAEEFWTDSNLQKLPYLRGDLIACYLNRMIRERSARELSLDELMRELAKDGGREVTAALLYETFETWAGAEAAAQVRKWVEEGGPILLPGDTFAPCGELEGLMVDAFDVGFDLERSMEAGAVTGLREGSPAARNGLVEGMPVRSWSVYRGRTDLPVEFVVVEEDGTERTVSFLPRGAKTPAQRLVAEDDCLGI